MSVYRCTSLDLQNPPPHTSLVHRGYIQLTLARALEEMLLASSKTEMNIDLLGGGSFRTN